MNVDIKKAIESIVKEPPVFVIAADSDGNLVFKTPLYTYQDQAMKFAPKNFKDDFKHSMSLAGLGISGEAGEVTDYIKKVIHHRHSLNKEKLKEELGDVCWYIAFTCDLIGCRLEDVLRQNIEKLSRRYPHGFNSEDSIHREKETMPTANVGEQVPNNANLTKEYIRILGDIEETTVAARRQCVSLKDINYCRQREVAIDYAIRLMKQQLEELTMPDNNASKDPPQNCKCNDNCKCNTNSIQADQKEIAIKMIDKEIGALKQFLITLMTVAMENQDRETLNIVITIYSIIRDWTRVQKGEK